MSGILLLGLKEVRTTSQGGNCRILYTLDTSLIVVDTLLKRRVRDAQHLVAAWMMLSTGEQDFLVELIPWRFIEICASRS